MVVQDPRELVIGFGASSDQPVSGGLGWESSGGRLELVPAVALGARVGWCPRGRTGMKEGRKLEDEERVLQLQRESAEVPDLGRA